MVCLLLEVAKHGQNVLGCGGAIGWRVAAHAWAHQGWLVHIVILFLVKVDIKSIIGLLLAIR